MAQTVQLNVSIKTREGVRTLKELKGSFQEVRDQIKNFKTDAISKEFKDINKVIDITNAKLDKFADTLGGKNLNLMFDGGGGLSGSGISGGGGRNSVRGSSAELVSIFNQMSRAVRDLVKTMNIANLSISRAIVGGGGGGRGRPPGTGGGGGGSSAGGFGAAGAQVLGGLGFSLVDAATQVRAVFSDKRVKNAFSDGAGKLFSLLGSIFGDSIASIAGDIGKAFGEIGEIAFNLLTLKFRVFGLALAAALKGIGVALGLSLFGGFSILTGGLGILAAGTLAVFSGLFSAVTSIMKELVDEALDVIQSLFKAAFSVITATIKTVITVFQSISRVIKGVWDGLWQGLKGIASASIEGIKQTVNSLGKTFFKLAADGVKAFAALEQGAIRGNKEIVDVVGRNETAFADVARNISSEFGNATKDVNELFFAAAGRGLLRRSGQNAVADFAKFAGSVARAAQADFATLAGVGNATISVLENYGLAISEVGRVTDLLNRTTTLGSTTMDELSSALANVLPSAAALGFGLEDTLASVAKITQTLGPGKAKNATRILNRLFEGLAIPTDKSRKGLESIGVAFDNLFDKSGNAKPGALLNILEQTAKIREGLANEDVVFRDIFPLKQARQAFLALTDDLEKLRDIRKDIEGIPIEPQREFARSGLLKRVQILGSTLSNISEKVLGSFLGKLLKSTIITDRMRNLFLKIQKITTGDLFNDNFLSLGKDVAKAFAPLSNIVGRVVENFGTFIQKLSEGKFNEQILRLADLLNMVGVTLITLGTQIFNVENLSSVFDTTITVVEKLIGILPKVKDLLKAAFSGDFKAAFELGGSIFESLFGISPSQVLEEVQQTIGDALKAGISSAAGLIVGLIDGFSTSLVGGLLDSIKNSTVVQALLAAGSLIATAFGQKIIEVLLDVLPVINNVLQSVLRSSDPIVSQIVDNLLAASNFLLATFIFGKSTFDNVIQPLLQVLNGFRIVFNAMVALAKSFFLNALGFGSSDIAQAVAPEQKKVNEILDSFEGRNTDINRKSTSSLLNDAFRQAGSFLTDQQGNLGGIRTQQQQNLSTATIKSQEDLKSSTDKLRETFVESIDKLIGGSGGGGARFKIPLALFDSLPTSTIAQFDVNEIELTD